MNELICTYGSERGWETPMEEPVENTEDDCIWDWGGIIGLPFSNGVPNVGVLASPSQLPLTTRKNKLLQKHIKKVPARRDSTKSGAAPPNSSYNSYN